MAKNRVVKLGRIEVQLAVVESDRDEDPADRRRGDAIVREVREEFLPEMIAAGRRRAARVRSLLCSGLRGTETTFK